MEEMRNIWLNKVIEMKKGIEKDSQSTGQVNPTKIRQANILIGAYERCGGTNIYG